MVETRSQSRLFHRGGFGSGEEEARPLERVSFPSLARDEQRLLSAFEMAHVARFIGGEDLSDVLAN